jgi:hypothetical protein
MPRSLTILAAAAAILMVSNVAIAKKVLVKRAKAAPVAAAPEAPLTEGQLTAANNVYTGKSDCEFNTVVELTPMEGKPGHFKLTHGKKTYDVVPEETTTGAVRLEDKKAGVVWIQIPAKSMLMNSKAGQRIADACMNERQRVATANSPT